MKGSEEKLLIYMDGSKKRFVIPVYQRNYDWKIEQCKQLFDDLVRIIKQKRKSHFFGSLVSVFDPGGTQLEFLIIDGQQRLTTVSLILLAMNRLITNGTILPKASHLGQQILEDYLVDKWEPEDTRIKLKPIKNDQKAFKKLFDNNYDYIPDSNLTINYNYFYDRIQKQEISIDELYEAIFKLEIINIVLNEDDNPQLIFESLNSTGLDLSEGDKIRNYILMGLSSKLQEKLYNKYWNIIEQCTGYDVSSFIRDYLSVKQQLTPAFRDVYYKFKDYVENNKFGDIEILLTDLLDYAKRYQHLLTANTKQKNINDCIYRLNRMKTTVTRPFFMEVLRMEESNKLSADDTFKVFSIIENYIFRRAICDISTNALNKVFLLLYKEIVRIDGTLNNYLEKLKFILQNKKEKGRYPDDEEFAEALSQKNIYAMRGETKLYLFERLENFDTLETKDVWNHFDNATYSIEHIMPQKLTADWMEELGDDYERIHSMWLHRLANLTITAYNAKYSNKSFSEKCNMSNGFKQSGLRINKLISEKAKWTESEIEDRDNMLQNKALTIWPYITTDYSPPNKQSEYVSLDDDVILTGRTILSFSFLGIEKLVNSWVDMYEEVLKILYEKDRSILTRLAVNKDSNIDLSPHFSTVSESFSAFRKIDNEIFVWTGIGTQYKTNVLKKIFVLYDIDFAELVFCLSGDLPNNSNEEGRFLIRRRYWSYSLPIIRERSELFSNVSPSKDNWINGYIGISGIHISCVANFDSARAELYIDLKEKKHNKSLFDYLYSQKESIANHAGDAFIWDRKNDTRASKIYLILTNVNISNEDDWHQMSEFHAYGCKLIKDAFLPKLEAYFTTS